MPHGASHHFRLAHRCRRNFDATIRARGEHYWQSGRVHSPVTSGTMATFSVQGSETYDVAVDWRNARTKGEITATCTCPHYVDGFLCKHSWAALLKLDELDIGATVPGTPDLLVLHADEDFDDEEFEDSEASPSPSSPSPGLSQIQAIQSLSHSSRSSATSQTPPSRIGHYVLDLDTSRSRGVISVKFYHQERHFSGKPGIIKEARVSIDDLPAYSDPLDREIMGTLLGMAQSSAPSPYSHTLQHYSGGRYSTPVPTFATAPLATGLQEDLLTKISRTGRFIRFSQVGYSRQGINPVSLSFDAGEPWRFEIGIRQEGNFYKVEGFLKRDDKTIPLSEALLLLKSGIVVFHDHLAKLDAHYHFEWIAALRREQAIEVPVSDGDSLVETLCSHPHTPPIQWPEGLQWKQERLSPVPKVIFAHPPERSGISGLLAELRFIYEDHEINSTNSSTTLLDRAAKRLILRNEECESTFSSQLGALSGIRPAPQHLCDRFSFQVFPADFVAVVNEISSWGWQIEAYGQRVRSSGDFQIEVSSGVDWFDLKGSATFSGGKSVELPALLSVLRRGEFLIPLGDGTVGMLPEKWLAKASPLALLGEATPQGFRFSRQQGAILATWFSEGPAIKTDTHFAKLMQTIGSRDTLKALKPHRTFQGKLRPYQEEGLAWLEFLAQTGFGGILADDMGLGKTVQLLAHLDRNKQDPAVKPGPSLVILPKSLMFNWREEAARFTPRLKVVPYAGADRGKYLKEIPGADVVLVTYSTLRMDIEQFRTFDFHMVIADEAQAIKNAKSLSHAACRLVRARHRLAMTGTPVENSANDLFAILDFVSPGLLGAGARKRVAEKPDADTLKAISQALRPFVLRRTKAQVLKDLPEKIEKVLHCELSPAEMREYAELRDYYRVHLQGEIARRGLARSKVVVLEALLRLRQCACHRALIDKKRIKSESTKVETLLAQLKEAISEGHKALVFSQFTAFMDIVGVALEKEKIPFTRLDGSTNSEDRRLRVTRFQEDSELKVFLISLKAGGVGLNLTAADYVFILDPWWNPAVESQAIDRTHRIGQRNKVIAYRFIAKDTVEEKIIELQKSKRELADALISADASLLKKLTAEDLELLLS